MNCIVLLLLYMYIVYYSPLNFLDIGPKQLLLCTIIQLFHCTNNIYIYSIFVFNFHTIENASLVYLILININLEVSIIDVIYVYIYIYYNLVTEMQAAVTIISVPGAYIINFLFIAMSYIFPK